MPQRKGRPHVLTSSPTSGTSNKLTASKEETTTSTSNFLGLQCNCNSGAIQHRIHHHYSSTYVHGSPFVTSEKKKKTSWPLVFTSTIWTSRTESAIRCSIYLKHVYLLTVFNGTSPTFPEWARELRDYLNINQFEHITFVDFAYDVEQPLATDIMVQWTPAGRQQHLKLRCLREAFQELQDELALPPRDPHRRIAQI